MKEFMKEAINEALIAENENEVPVGAVIVRKNKIIARNHNRVIQNKDITAHAEMLVIKDCCKKLNTTNLSDCEIYITLEPCPMCAGAIMHSKIKKVVYALDEFSFGSLGSYINLKNNPHFKNTSVYAGIMEEESKQIIKRYFKKIRNEKA